MNYNIDYQTIEGEAFRDSRENIIKDLDERNIQYNIEEDGTIRAIDDARSSAIVEHRKDGAYRVRPSFTHVVDSDRNIKVKFDYKPVKVI